MEVPYASSFFVDDHAAHDAHRMVGIILVIGVIVLAVMLLNRLTRRK